MNPVAQCAYLCADTYNPAAQWDHRWVVDEVVVCHRVIDGVDHIAFEGSKTLTDWMRDFFALPVWHGKLGIVHAGFVMGLDAVLDEVRAAIRGPLVITGHSLGGARARDFAALCAVNGIGVALLCVFGSPKPGFGNLARLIQKAVADHRSFRNRNDPVTEVPIADPARVLDWQHPEPYQVFDEHAGPSELEPLRDHHIDLYVKGALKL